MTPQPIMVSPYEPPLTQVTGNVKNETYYKVKQLAIKNGVSKSAIVRSILENYFAF